VVDIPFELRPTIPEQGISASEHGLGHSDKVDEHLRRLAEREGVPFTVTDHVPKTHKAMVMAEVAREEGVHGPVHRAIFEAYFGHGEDIGDETVLLRIATEHSIAPERVVEAWAEGAYEERLHAFYHLGLDLGVDSTPAALICNELLIGTRPYGVIRDAVQRCLVTSDNVAEAVED
jgi:predicted DsbA family dithiol-disulfide isomerase